MPRGHHTDAEEQRWEGKTLGRKVRLGCTGGTPMLPDVGHGGLRYRRLRRRGAVEDLGGPGGVPVLGSNSGQSGRASRFFAAGNLGNFPCGSI